MKSPARRAATAHVLVALACGAVAGLAQALGLFEPLELPLYDLRVAVRFVLGPPSRAAERIAVVAVDEPSLEQLGRWPWSRSVHARLLERLSAASPLAVGLDLVLSEPSSGPAGEADDRALAEAARRVPGLVLPGGEEAPYPELAREAARLASIHFPLDRDGRIRRLMPSASDRAVSEAQGLPLALALAQIASRATAEIGPLTGAAHARTPLVDQNQAGRPVVWLDLRRPPVSRWPIRAEDLFPTYSYADVLGGRVGPEQLAGRIVIVGVTAAGVAGGDRHMTALSALGPVPGVIVHANAVRALLDDGAVRRPGWPGSAPLAGALLTAGLALAAGLAARAFGRWAGAAPALVLAGYWALAAGVFVSRGLWLEMAGPGVALAMEQVGFGLVRLAEERQRRREVEALFGRYVAPAVLDELMKAPGAPHPGGQRREVSLLMADLCGFTALAEQNPPEAVLQTLNAYLEALAGPVLEAGGTLDKYLGDGVMAIFGAPLVDPHHARTALACAWEIRRRVEALNRTRRAQGLPALEVRAGVHCGEAVLGNIGTPQRMDYTAIGDAVNVCSRLQGEAAPGEILVTRQALEAAGGVFPGPVDVTGPELIPIRGRRDPVEAFRVRPASPVDPTLHAV